MYQYNVSSIMSVLKEPENLKELLIKKANKEILRFNKKYQQLDLSKERKLETLVSEQIISCKQQIDDLQKKLKILETNNLKLKHEINNKMELYLTTIIDRLIIENTTEDIGHSRYLTVNKNIDLAVFNNFIKKYKHVYQLYIILSLEDCGRYGTDLSDFVKEHKLWVSIFDELRYKVNHNISTIKDLIILIQDFDDLSNDEKMYYMSLSHHTLIHRHM